MIPTRRARRAGHLLLAVVGIVATIIATQLPASAAAPPGRTDGKTALQLLEDPTQTSSEALMQLRQRAASAVRPEAMATTFDCAGWDCVAQFIDGWKLMQANVMDVEVDKCCTDIAVYFRKQVSQGLNLMYTAGVYAPVLMYFASLAVCVGVGAGIAAIATPFAGAAAERLCDAQATFYDWQFWQAVQRAERESSCLTVRFYSSLYGLVPEFGTEGGEKCRW